MVKQNKKAHSKALNSFCKFMSGQDKINSADDLLPQLHYTYMTSTNGTNMTWCRLWLSVNGCMTRSKRYDCQLNVEVRPFDCETIYARIAYHKRGESLSDVKAWVWEDDHTKVDILSLALKNTD